MVPKNGHSLRPFEEIDGIPDIEGSPITCRKVVSLIECRLRTSITKKERLSDGDTDIIVSSIDLTIDEDGNYDKTGQKGA